MFLLDRRGNHFYWGDCEGSEAMGDVVGGL